MLYLFDRCYRKGDPKMMHVSQPLLQIEFLDQTFLFPILLQHCAQTLLDFNGGASCVQVYVNQHDFFINNRVREAQTSNDDALFVLIFSLTRAENHIDSDHIQLGCIIESRCRSTEDRDWTCGPFCG